MLRVVFVLILLKHVLSVWNLENMPNPKSNPQACGRNLGAFWRTSAVCDPAKIMPKDGQDAVEGLIKNIQEKTDNQVEFAVALVDKIDPSMLGVFTNIDEATETFARGLHDKWGVGDSETHNGILLFISTNDRTVFISIGSGVQSHLSDVAIDFIIDSAKPAMRKGEWALVFSSFAFDIGKKFDSSERLLDIPGIEDFQAKRRQHYSRLRRDSLGNLIDTDVAPDVEPAEPTLIENLFGMFIVVGLACIAFWLVSYVRKEGSMSRGRDALRSYAREVGSGDNRYEVTTCAICLEAFADNAVVQGADAGDADAASCTSGSDVDGRAAADRGVGAATVETVEDAEGGAPSSSSSSPPPPSSSSSQENNENPKRPVALPCAHIFCCECITEWVNKGHNTCPVCRVAFDEGDCSSSSSSTSSHSSSSGAGTHTRTETTSNQNDRVFSSRYWRSRPLRYRSSHQSRVLDRQFRLHRLHTLYPQVVDQDTMQALTVALGNDSFTSASQIATTRAKHITDTLAAMAASRKSGSTGSSSRSFGGGRSSGGRGSRF